MSNSGKVREEEIDRMWAEEAERRVV